MYDFMYCMQRDCKTCKRFKECDLNDVEEKNKDSNKRIKQKRERSSNKRDTLSKSRRKLNVGKSRK